MPVDDDTYRLQVEEKIPWLFWWDQEPLPPSTLHEEGWGRSTIIATNQDDTPGYFRLWASGDPVSLGPWEFGAPAGKKSLVAVPAEYGWRCSVRGTGPKDFTLHWERAEWEEEVSQLVSIPQCAGLTETPRPTARTGSGVTVRKLATRLVEVNEERPGDQPGVSIENASFPDCVGADEDWTGSIVVRNSGEGSGFFRLRLTGDFSFDRAYDLRPGDTVGINFNSTGPKDSTLHVLFVKQYNEKATLDASVPLQRDPPGQLTKLDMPCWEVSTPWSGSVNMVNNDTEEHTFRTKIECGSWSTTSHEAQLQPEGSTSVPWECPEPKGNVTLTLQRLESGNWVVDDVLEDAVNNEEAIGHFKMSAHSRVLADNPEIENSYIDVPWRFCLTPKVATSSGSRNATEKARELQMDPGWNTVGAQQGRTYRGKWYLTGVLWASGNYTWPPDTWLAVACNLHPT